MSARKRPAGIATSNLIKSAMVGGNAVDIVNELTARGMRAKDLFVLVRTGAPSVSRIVRQVHARKSHSYFLVFVK